jgi:hypothetical protein
VIKITKEDVVEVLRACVGDSKKLDEGAVRGMQYVERLHRPDSVAARTIEIYDKARRARRSG